MGKDTKIEYCDSTVNVIVGCDGCELWNPGRGIRDCYAGQLVGRYAGLPGWPASFDKPQVFPERLEQAINWPDLTGTDRPEKPWLNGYPRLIFPNDLSDTFTPSVSYGDLYWMFERMTAGEHHIWLVLTKRASRMRNHLIGEKLTNIWPGTTVTSERTLNRIRYLQEIDAKVKWVSFEPLLGPVDLRYVLGEPPWGFDWAVVGGMSKSKYPTKRTWINDLISQLEDAGVPVFFKQWGSLDANPDKQDPTTRENGGNSNGGRRFYGHFLNGMPRIE